MIAIYRKIFFISGGMDLPQIQSRRLDVGLIDIAPAPVLTRLEGLYERMVGRVEVLSGMLILRGVAAADVSTSLADAQMHPGIPECQTFFTTIGAGSNLVDQIEMCTNWIPRIFLFLVIYSCLDRVMGSRT